MRWGCPARGHGAVATQTRGCSQCLYQRLPKSYGNIRVNAAGRAVTICQRRVSRSRRCSYSRNRGIISKIRAARISPRVQEKKEGPGTTLGGGFPWGFPREDPECARRPKERSEERDEKRKTNDCEIAGSARERRRRRRWNGSRLPPRDPFYQDRHPATCQQTLPIREKHVGEKSPGKHEDGESAAK